MRMCQLWKQRSARFYTRNFFLSRALLSSPKWKNERKKCDGTEKKMKNRPKTWVFTRLHNIRHKFFFCSARFQSSQHCGRLDPLLTSDILLIYTSFHFYSWRRIWNFFLFTTFFFAVAVVVDGRQGKKREEWRTGEAFSHNFIMCTYSAIVSQVEHLTLIYSILYFFPLQLTLFIWYPKENLWKYFFLFLNTNKPKKHTLIASPQRKKKWHS